MCPINLAQGAGQEKALRYAATLARMYAAKLYVCHSIENVELLGTQIVEATEEDLRKYVGELMSTLFFQAEEAAPDWESFVVSDNDPSEAIAREAAERRVDLIVMCSRRRPLRAALIGSTAERVCRTAPCPVLVTHPDQREWMNGKPDALRLKRVLVAHDFSDYAEVALNYARLFAQKNRVELHLLHVLPAPLINEPELAWTQGVAEGAYHKAARQLQHFVPTEAGRWHEVKTVVRWGKPYGEVLAYAKDQQIDLICMGAHGAGFEIQALFGSNVDRVLRQAPCPVLIARPLKPSLAEPDFQDLFAVEN
jgi:nucleotide-binding universal stress UspA family protein